MPPRPRRPHSIALRVARHVALRLALLTANTGASAAPGTLPWSGSVLFCTLCSAVAWPSLEGASVEGRTVLRSVTVAVPATTANLGPGFDCLGLTLDLWNEVTVSLEGKGVRISVEGEGAGRLPEDESNPIAAGALALLAEHGVVPEGLVIGCRNAVPPASGLGSSATAAIAGSVAANTLLGGTLTHHDIMVRAIRQEGHPDNVAAALYGGLAVVAQDGDDFIVRRFDLPRLDVAVVVPDHRSTTRAARAKVPRQVSLEDAVFNIGRTALVVDALRTGDLELLRRTMDDRLHQHVRMASIPGAAAALRAGREAGAAAVALSGSGPSLIAFAGSPGGTPGLPATPSSPRSARRARPPARSSWGRPTARPAWRRCNRSGEAERTSSCRSPSVA